MEFYLIDHEATLEDIEKFHFPNQKVGVIAHIETLDGKVLLQQRGVKSRDENGLFEDIGGTLERLEPEKCIGYRFFQKEEALDSNLVTESCKFIIQKISEKE